jgi:hypothetical protein
VQDGAAARRLAVVKVRAVAPRLPIGAIVDDVEYSHGNSVHTTTTMYRLTPTDDQFLAALGPCGK